MASTSGCSQQLKDLQLSDTSCTMGDSMKKSDFATSTTSSEGEYGTMSTSYLSSVEELIEQLKAHWSTLVEHLGDSDEDEVDYRVSNAQEFLTLQEHATWGDFFANFTGDAISTGLYYKDSGALMVGKKFAEGGQAEIYEAHIKWIHPKNEEKNRRLELEYVLKVFKEGTLLKHVKSQMPQGLLQSHVEELENSMSPTPKKIPMLVSNIQFGILLKSGRFAILMQKQHFDLRTLIERNMKLRSVKDQGPFSKAEGELLLYEVALGVDWLHNRDIVHRDLKASNVLVHEFDNGRPKWHCYVADYECSVGVVGTNFFRAPEILQVCKERKVNERHEVFSKASDVYSYGMTCYEVLIGKLPFEDHPLSDNPSLLIDLVVNQHLRPEIPEYVEDWARELLVGCWQFDPTTRPRIEEILSALSTNSRDVRKYKVVLKEDFGENWRW